MLTILVVGASSFSMPVDARPPGVGEDTSGVRLYPEPTTMDIVTHNLGNIATTIDNWGLVGGYWYYLPSGEWPRNSGHNYLAEIRYWMGAVVGNDTLVVNSYDDMQGLQMPVNGTDAYKIYLSTDTNRYYDYDITDTLGAGHANPAFGWRVWDAASETYVYNTFYDPVSTDFVSGGPTSLQDSHYRMGDAALGSSLMGLEMTHSVMQWNYCYNEDFIIFVLEITNTSATDYADFAFGLYADFDVGGLDGEGGNGNMEDSVVYDTDEDWAYTFDVVGVDPGWGPTVQTGIMGTKVLETPDDIGITAFRTDDWSYLPDDDAGRFEMINSTRFDNPLPPTDQYYIQCVRGINLTAGSTVRIVYALVAGADSADFVSNARMAQTMYDNYYVGPEPPPTPVLKVQAGHEEVYLSWGDTSEVATDPLSGVNDFLGYKLYRSENLGRTWGTEDRDNDNDCLAIDYIPIATFVVDEPGDPIAHSYVDDDLINGVEYWYCLVAFDRGDETIDPLQSGFGTAGGSPNVVAVRPECDPAGFYEAATTVEHTYEGNEQASEGEVIPTVFDRAALRGSEYSVRFEDTDTCTYWHLIDNATGDTVLAHQDVYNADPELYPIAEGLRVVVLNPPIEPADISQTGMAGGSVTLEVENFNGPAITFLGAPSSWADGYARYRTPYELRYTEDSTLAPWVWDPMVPGAYDPVPVPFEVWNMLTNERVSLVHGAWDYQPAWQPGDSIMIVNYPYDPADDLDIRDYYSYYVWHFNLESSVYDPSPGDVLTFESAPLSGPGDVFTFQVDGINDALAQQELSDIKVAPNPYFVRYSSRVETNEGQSMLFFNNLPVKCTIRIYSLAGDLVRTIEHDDDTGSETWDLLSSGGRLVAAGNYLYHVESAYGNFLGRFAVIK